MATISLERKNGRPLRFEGSLILEATTRAEAGDLWHRWNEVAIYRWSAGYVVAIRYRSVLGDPEEDTAEYCSDGQQLMLQLRTYGPGVYFAASPTSVSEFTRQAQVYSNVRGAYYRLINQLLGREEFTSVSVIEVEVPNEDTLPAQDPD